MRAGQRGSEGARGSGGINNYKFRNWNGPDGTRVGHIGLSLKHMKLDLGHYRLIRDQRGSEGWEN